MPHKIRLYCAAMNSLRIVVAMGKDEEALGRLRDRLPAGSNIEFLPWAHSSKPAPAEVLRDAEILFCEYPPSNFTDCGRLRWIQLDSVGFAQLYGLGLPQRGIRATNARGVFDVPIAEWCIAMMVIWRGTCPVCCETSNSTCGTRARVFRVNCAARSWASMVTGASAGKRRGWPNSFGLEVWVLARSADQTAGADLRCPGNRRSSRAVSGSGFDARHRRRVLSRSRLPRACNAVDAADPGDHRRGRTRIASALGCRS